MSAIILDFDGTLGDTFDFVADFLADESGQSPLSETKKASLRGHSMQVMARRLGYRWWSLPQLFLRGRRRMQDNVGQIKPFQGMPEVIQKLHAEGHELFILSSNSVRNIHAFLHAHDLHTYFLEIYGNVGLFGKAPALRRLLRGNDLDINNAIYIGDEMRDVEAAQSIKMAVIAVKWGFARPQDLQALHPTALAEKPADIITILESL